jgi:hypothetical protein
MTIESVEIIKKILQNDGVYDGDLRVYRIYSYRNVINKMTFAIYYVKVDLLPSPYVREPITLLFEDGLTEAGLELLKELA